MELAFGFAVLTYVLIDKIRNHSNYSNGVDH